MVQRVRLGDELTVSAIGFGAMALTPVYGEVDDTESLATLNRSIDLGVSFVDTANVYGGGENETLISRLLADRRDEVTLATKFGITGNPAKGTRGSRGDAAYVRQAIDESLSRLQTDVVDLYYIHRRDLTVPIEETVGAMAELVEAGKVRHLGLSEASAATVRRAHATHPITALQTEYSLFTRDLEDEILPVLRELGIGLVPYSPLGRGLLTGTITAPPAEGDSRGTAYFPRFQGEALDANLELVSRVREVAADQGCTPGQLALAWVLAQGEDVVPIPGTKRVHYLEENVAATDVDLTAADLARLEEAVPRGAVQGERYGDMSHIDA